MCGDTEDITKCFQSFSPDVGDETCLFQSLVLAVEGDERQHTALKKISVGCIYMRNGINFFCV
jgi:hypothetical protein